jgi:proteasome lid subunit RPN8/RPN11
LGLEKAVRTEELHAGSHSIPERTCGFVLSDGHEIPLAVQLPERHQMKEADAAWMCASVLMEGKVPSIRVDGKSQDS